MTANLQFYSTLVSKHEFQILQTSWPELEKKATLEYRYTVSESDEQSLKPQEMPDTLLERQPSSGRKTVEYVVELPGTGAALEQLDDVTFVLSELREAFYRLCCLHNVEHQHSRGVQGCDVEESVPEAVGFVVSHPFQHIP